MFKGQLRQYQLDTVFFMQNKKAVFVGHDMGLGKTAICLYYCELTKHLNTKKVLILCPSTVINTWKQEIEKWTNSSYVIIEGSPKTRQKQWQEDVYYYITNYEKLRTDLQMFHKVWGIIIVDECTKLKNFSTLITRQSSNLKAYKKIALSGFPIHNSPVDLYSIINFFLIPYFFGRYQQFKDKYLVIETDTNSMGYQYTKIVGYKNLDMLKQQIIPFFIRKTKQEVLTELPPLIFETLTVDLTPNQLNVYNEIVNSIDKHEPQLHLLTALKLLSDHPELLKNTEGNEIKQFGIMVNDFKSNKLDVLLEFLEEVEHHKIVIFSQYVKMLDIISKYLQTSYSFVRGDRTKEENNNNILKFKTDPNCRILLSSDAGAFGLNLQEASIVIHYDLPWNPAIYKQRIDRVYRMGQNKGVVVVNFITNSTIENRVLQILLSKLNMIDKVVEGSIEKNFTQQIFEVINESNN